MRKMFSFMRTFFPKCPFKVFTFCHLMAKNIETGEEIRRLEDTTWIQRNVIFIRASFQNVFNFYSNHLEFCSFLISVSDSATNGNQILFFFIKSLDINWLGDFFFHRESNILHRNNFLRFYGEFLWASDKNLSGSSSFQLICSEVNEVAYLTCVQFWDDQVLSR